MKAHSQVTTMKLLTSVTFIIFASTVKGQNSRTFPNTFLFGVGSSAYQIEGAWNEDGKGENIWDHWVHDNIPHIKDNATGDIACDSYHRYDAVDLSLARTYLRLDFYEISISWSRILPTGFDNYINREAIEYYQNFIDSMVRRRLMPVVTLYHNDLPQPLQDIGGWTNPDMENYYVKFARVAFQYFDKVQYWITFNEPRSQCRLGYGEGVYAPGISLDGVGDYLCAYTMVRSHAAVYHMYKEEFPHLNARVSMAIDFQWSEPATNSTADVKAAERRNMFEFGLYAHPIYAGNWPQVVIDRVASRSKNEHLPKSRLPEFTQGEIDYINGTFDFMAVNIRSTDLVKDIPEPEFEGPGYMKDIRVELTLDPDWDLSASGDPIVPWGARKSLKWLRNTYNYPEIFITKNGVSDDGSTYQDVIRINFYRDYLNAILDAIYEDGVRVFAYTAWSLLDSFEWSEGYSQHYGLYTVNRTDLSTKLKASGEFYSRVANTHQIPDDETTPTTKITTTPTRTTTPTSTTTPTPTTTTISTTTGAANRITFYPLLVSCITFFCYLLR